MGRSKKRHSPFFFNYEDEGDLSSRLKKKIPSVRFINGSRWPDANPPCRETIPDCNSAVVFLWAPEVPPILPYRVLDDGRVQGPTSGVVIQYVRSELRNGVLQSGDVGVGYDETDEEMKEFVGAVWRVLGTMKVCHLRTVDAKSGEVLEEQIPNFLVGKGARRMSLEGVPLNCGRPGVNYQAR